MKATMKKGCPHCPRVFKADGNDGMAMGRLAANLTNHIKGAHPEKYTPSKWVLDRQIRKERVKHALDRAVNKSTTTIKPQILISGPDPEPVKRPYARKPQPQSIVCFCPQCGCNIRAVQVAMGI